MLPTEHKRLTEKRLIGIFLSPGIAIGRPCFYVPQQNATDSSPSSITGLSNDGLRHGVLNEVPAACLDATRIMRAADFGCIGANDLIQYLFGIDRTNAATASYRGFENELVLSELLKQLVLAASSCGKSLTICSELAGNPDLMHKIIECGITAASTNPANVGMVHWSAEQCDD